MALDPQLIDRAYRLYYGEQKHLGEVAAELGCGIYDLSPWLTSAAMRIGAAAMYDERAQQLFQQEGNSGRFFSQDVPEETRAAYRARAEAGERPVLARRSPAMPFAERPDPPSPGWAGPLANIEALARDYGLAMKDVAGWARDRQVICFTSGAETLLFPVEQFEAGKPIEGIGGVLAAAGSPRSAWLWLTRPHDGLEGVPLQTLAGDPEWVKSEADAFFAIAQAVEDRLGPS